MLCPSHSVIGIGGPTAYESIWIRYSRTAIHYRGEVGVGRPYRSYLWSPSPPIERGPKKSIREADEAIYSRVGSGSAPHSIYLVANTIYMDMGGDGTLYSYAR